MKPHSSGLVRAHSPAEVLSFLLIKCPAMVAVSGVNDVQVGSSAQRFFCTKAGKQGVGGYLLLALGAEGTKGLNETARHRRELYPGQREAFIAPTVSAKGLRRGADRFAISPEAAANLSSSQPGNKYGDHFQPAKEHRRSGRGLSLKPRIAKQRFEECAPRVAPEGGRARPSMPYTPLVYGRPEQVRFSPPAEQAPMVDQFRVVSVPQTDDSETARAGHFDSAVSATCSRRIGGVFGTPGRGGEWC